MNQELIKALQTSGNNLHLDIAEILERDGWKVELSSYYFDDITDKPREIDIVATLEVRTPTSPISTSSEKFNVNLFIECKHFTQDIAFRMNKAKPDKLMEALLVEVYNKNEIVRQSDLESIHHHLKLKLVGVLYDASNKLQKDIFDAITQPIKSYSYFQDKLQQGLTYLAVIYRGIDGIYPISSPSDLTTLPSLNPVDDLTMGINYSSKKFGTKSKYFLIDFIHEKKIIDYLKQIKNESSKLRDLRDFQLNRDR